MRRGIFGGSFNPPHMGHIKSLESILKKTGLDAIHVVPTNQNPAKMQMDGPSASQRMEMTKLALEGFSKKLVLDDREIRRGGMSYTIDTLKDVQKEFPKDELVLIVGLDQFEDFSSWKDYPKILEIANLMVTSRPGFDIPSEEAELPEFIKPMLKEFDFNVVELKSGKTIEFVEIQDVDTSSSELRKMLRVGQKVEQFVPLSVERYVRDNKLYKATNDKVGDYLKFTKFCAQQVEAGKGIQVKAFDLTGISAPAEYTLVASGTSTRHTEALAENLIRSVKQEYSVNPQSVEGFEEGRWVVVDYGTTIIHVFYDFVRNEYALENLWKQGKPIDLTK